MDFSRLYTLNEDQLNGLADFCFDIGKAAAISVLLPPLFVPKLFVVSFIDSLRGLLVTIGSLSAAMLILRVKWEVKGK